MGSFYATHGYAPPATAGGFASKVGTRAPTARNMTARGKREAKRSASPLVTDNQMFQPWKGVIPCVFRPFRPWILRAGGNPRATRFALAQGCYISRRWRSPSDFW